MNQIFPTRWIKQRRECSKQDGPKVTNADVTLKALISERNDTVVRSAQISILICIYRVNLRRTETALLNARLLSTAFSLGINRVQTRRLRDSLLAACEVAAWATD